MKHINLIEAVQITKNRIKPFSGNRSYLSTGDLLGREINDIVTIDYKTKPSRADLCVNVGDILVARMRATNKVLLIDEKTKDLIVSTGFLTLSTKKGFDVRYIAHYLRSNIFQREKDKYCSGATQKAINNSAFQKLKLPYHPLDEQKTIVRILDSVDNLRQKRKLSSKLLNELVRASFLTLFGDPIKNEKKWQTIVLKDIANINRGRFSPRPRNDPSYYGGRYPFIQTGDINNSRYRLKEWSQTLNDKGTKVSRQFNKGTVVIAIVGATIGATAILEIDTYAPDSVIGIDVDRKKATNTFIEYLLRFYKPIFVAQAPETARANINLETLRPLKIILPPLQQQVKFSNIINAVEEIFKKLNRSETEIKNQFDALIDKYFNENAHDQRN